MNPGLFTVTGYVSFEGRTESTSAEVTITAPKAEPAPELATSSWDPAPAPAPNSVVPVTASSRGGALTVGTASAVIVERNSKPAAPSESGAPRVLAPPGQTVLVNVPSLPAGSKVKVK